MKDETEEQLVGEPDNDGIDRRGFLKCMAWAGTSKALDTDETFTYTFTKPGTYSYFCSIHPKMTAKVVVQ